MTTDLAGINPAVMRACVRKEGRRRRNFLTDLC